MTRWFRQPRQASVMSRIASTNGPSTSTSILSSFRPNSTSASSSSVKPVQHQTSLRGYAWPHTLQERGVDSPVLWLEGSPPRTERPDMNSGARSRRTRSSVSSVIGSPASRRQALSIKHPGQCLRHRPRRLWTRGPPRRQSPCHRPLLHVAHAHAIVADVLDPLPAKLVTFSDSGSWSRRISARHLRLFAGVSENLVGGRLAEVGVHRPRPADDAVKGVDGVRLEPLAVRKRAASAAQTRPAPASTPPPTWRWRSRARSQRLALRHLEDGLPHR